MATAYKTPGVYVEEISKFPPSVAAVETAIPAFIGYTAIAQEVTAGDLVNKPKRISSLVEYETYFGGAQPETAVQVTIATATDGTRSATATLAEVSRSLHILFYEMQMFFANGGGPCYVVSAGIHKTLGTALVETELHAALDAVAKEDEPTLIVIPEAQYLGISDFGTLQTGALAQCATLQNRFVIMDAHGDTVSLSIPNTPTGKTITDAMNNFRPAVGANNLKYGAAYAPNIETVLDFAVDESATVVTIGANSPKLADLNDHTNTAAFDTQAYNLAKAAIMDLGNTLPPSGAVAGIYAAVDNARGVWKAPANVSVNAVIQPAIPITNADQDGMNVDPTTGKSVNAIRNFAGLGTLVWGARTLAGNDNEWRYVNVRRFTIFAETSIRKAAQQFTFEPNDANTWVKVQGMIENFLTTLWRQGALQGVKPEDAFYVAVGLGKTMTADDILEGRMIVEVGMAVVRPAEFIILQFSQLMAVS